MCTVVTTLLLTIYVPDSDTRTITQDVITEYFKII